MSQTPNRQRRREMIAIEREQLALELMVAGNNQTEIGKRLGLSQGYISTLLNRALERRAAPDNPDTVRAREIYVLRLEALVRAYWPLATGTFRADPDDLAAPPDVRTGELLLKILTQLAAVQSRTLGEAVQAGQRMDVYHHVGDDQSTIAAIMAQLAETARHSNVVEGSLAAVGTELDALTGGKELDSKPHAPADWQPPELQPERDAA